MGGGRVDGEGEAAGEGALDRLELSARVSVLEAENRRLREEYVRARRSRYRRTALGLGLVAAVAAAGALALPGSRDVLLALAGTGAFAAVLVGYLTPERFVAATVADAVYEAFAANEAALVDALELAGDPVYVPGPSGVRLFVPVHADATVPEAADGPFVVGDVPTEAGLALVPSAARLLEETRTALGGDLAGEPDRLADQLADALVDGFELVDAAAPDVHAGEGRAVVSVEGSALGSVARFDHPVASLFGSGMAAGLDAPVRVEVASVDGEGDYLVSCRWDAGDGVTAEAAE